MNTPMHVTESFCLNGKSRGYITTHHGRSDQGVTWDNGEVFTPYGIVSVYAQGDDLVSEHTHMDFIHKGRVYHRTWVRIRLTARGMTRAATCFAREISTNEK